MGSDYQPLKVVNTAIMVDGAFYLKRARHLNGPKSPQDRADELMNYCHSHVGRSRGRFLYRIFYYDCPPSGAVVWNPITRKNESLAKTNLYSWSNDFFDCLYAKRKVAVRMGELLDTQGGYNLKPEAFKKLMNGTLQTEDITQQDLILDVRQKGVDMKLGLDVATLALGNKVDQIIMVAGDSDFVPAAKLARRNGIDFILDPMGATISKSLSRHIDGKEQGRFKEPEDDD